MHIYYYFETFLKDINYNLKKLLSKSVKLNPWNVVVHNQQRQITEHYVTAINFHFKQNIFNLTPLSCWSFLFRRTLAWVLQSYRTAQRRVFAYIVRQRRLISGPPGNHNQHMSRQSRYVRSPRAMSTYARPLTDSCIHLYKPVVTQPHRPIYQE